MLSKLFIAYVGCRQVDTWTEAHDQAVGFFSSRNLDWGDSTCVDGSLIVWCLILIVVVDVAGVVTEVPVCEWVL